MKSDYNKKLEKLFLFIKKYSNQFGKIPNVFKDRILKLSILSFLILLLGVFMLHKMGIRFFVCSAGISLFGFWRSYRIFYCAVRKNYEIVAGIVLKVKGRHTFGQFYRVTVQMEKGTETDLLLDKQTRVTVGKMYKFYFGKKEENIFPGGEKVRAAFNLGTFYGMEEL